MRTNRSNTILSAVLMLVSAVMAAPVLAQPRFDFVGNPNGLNSTVQSLSYDGRAAAGYSGGTGFRWTRDGGRVDFGAPQFGTNSQAYAISGDGKVVTGDGKVSSTLNQAFRRFDDGSVQGLGFLPGFSFTYGSALNHDGSVVVGTAYQSGGGNTQEPFRWTAATGITRLSGSPGGYGQALDISGDGKTVVGNINPGSIFNPQRAFVWHEGSGFSYLADERGIVDGNTVQAITPDGRKVLGTGSFLVGSEVHFGAMLWTDGVPMHLGSPPPGGLGSGGWGLSDDASVVIGRYGNGSQIFPFIWTEATGEVNAIDYLRNHGVQLASDTVKMTLSCVSGDGLSFGGQIFAPSLPNGAGGFVATVPAPSTLLLSITSLVALGARRRRAFSTPMDPPIAIRAMAR